MRRQAAILIGLLAAVFLAGSGSPPPFVPQPSVLPVNFTCRTGLYLVGFSVHAHDYVDTIAANCAPWNGRHLGAIVYGWVLEEGEGVKPSQGGEPQVATCPPDQAIREMTYRLPNLNGTFVLERLVASCNPLAPPHAWTGPNPEIRTTGDAQNQGGYSGDPHRFVTCDDGKIANGIYVAIGKYVGEIRLDCVAYPPAVSATAADIRHLFGKPAPPLFPRHRLLH